VGPSGWRDRERGAERPPDVHLVDRNPRSPGDPLRAEIEVALRDELRRRRASTLRWSLVGVGVAVALVSVVLNVLIVGDPGRVGLASESSVTQVQKQVDALAAQQAADSTRVVARLRAVETTTGTAIPALCAAVDRVGAWAFVGGTTPKSCTVRAPKKP
jgi:hypothetical protein